MALVCDLNATGRVTRRAPRHENLAAMEPARVSEYARAKADVRRTPDGLPIHGFTTLPADLAALTLNEVTLPGSPDHAIALRAVQSRAPWEMIPVGCHAFPCEFRIERHSQICFAPPHSLVDLSSRRITEQ